MVDPDIISEYFSSPWHPVNRLPNYSTVAFFVERKEKGEWFGPIFLWSGRMSREEKGFLSK